jgi:putative oxidoreductase
MKRAEIPDIIAFLLILLFTYAAVSKILIFHSFKIQLLIQPIPRWSVGILAYAIPSAELLAVISLFFKVTRVLGFYASAILMLAFSAYVGLAMTGVLGDIPCSCGGVISHLTWPQHFVFNLFFLLLSTYGIIIDHKERRFIGK